MHSKLINCMKIKFVINLIEIIYYFEFNLIKYLIMKLRNDFATHNYLFFIPN